VGSRQPTVCHERREGRTRPRQEGRPARRHRATDLGRGRARRGQARVTDARLWYPWLRINRVLRVMLHTRWSAEEWSQVRVEFRKALELARLKSLRTAGDLSNVEIQTEIADIISHLS
jgi:hypothetical protein